MSHHRLQNLLSELQSPPWFRSVDLGLVVLWDLIRILDACESLLEFMERDSRITLGFGVSSSSWVQKWKWCPVLIRVASNFEFRRLLGISKAWCDAIGFFGGQSKQEKLKG